MRWEEERYVRVYTRDTVEWDMLPWEARALWPLLLRRLDRAGLLELGKHGTKGLAVTVKIPFEVVEPGLAGLIDDGCVELHGTTLVVPNFMDAQETPSSNAQRSRESRARARDTKRAESATERVDNDTPDELAQQDDTPRHSDPIRTDPKEGEIARAHVDVSALSRAWSNGGLHGMPHRDDLAPIAEALEQLGLEPLKACQAWRRLLAGMAARSGAITKQQPAKMLEHLRGGLIQQVISGEIVPERLAEAKNGRREPAPAPRQSDGSDILARLKAVVP